jgi:hypothetical protein
MTWKKINPDRYIHSSGLAALRREEAPIRAGLRRARKGENWRWVLDLSDQRGGWHQHATYSNVSHAKKGATRLMRSDDFWQG